MKYAIITGFARSGKSTLQNELKRIGVPCASSSDILAVETLKYLNIPVNPENLKVLETKDETEFFTLCKKHTPSNRLGRMMSLINMSPTRYKVDGLNIRNAKIFVAEEQIVPRYTRKFFAERCFEVVTAQRGNLFVIFSTIELEQRYLFSIIADKAPESQVIRVNIRSSEECPGADSRSLFTHPDIELYNPMTTPARLLNLFSAELFKLAITK